jgi:hypothetical protein
VALGGDLELRAPLKRPQAVPRALAVEEAERDLAGALHTEVPRFEVHGAARRAVLLRLPVAGGARGDQDPAAAQDGDRQEHARGHV